MKLNTAADRKGFPGSKAIESLPVRRILILAGLAAALGLFVGWQLAARYGRPVLEPGGLTVQRPSIGSDRLELKPVGFADLPGWPDRGLDEARTAFLRSCEVLPTDGPLDGFAWAGTAEEWRPICTAMAEVPVERLQEYLEESLRPVAVSNRGRPRGLFTGYYEPTLHGSRRRHGAFTVPLHKRPPELVAVDLGVFRPDLKGRRIAGRVDEGRLRPWEERAEIADGSLGGRGLELVWVDDQIDRFFLQVQGSGIVELDDGGLMRVGYDGQNGHPYYAIGRELIARGEVRREEMSMQAIRGWLAEHPEQAGALLATNRSYVFFRELTGLGPLGAQGVALVPGRALAVDRRHLPMGIPAWIDTEHPNADPELSDLTLQRLVVLQDTGGSIRGPVRGDVFFGPGEEAAAVAGRMKHSGRIWLLLPAGVSERLGEHWSESG